MLTPHTIRIWCKAVMAPALTETATQARVKLTGSTTTGQDERELGSRQSLVVEPEVKLASEHCSAGDTGLETSGKLHIHNYGKVKDYAKLKTAQSLVSDTRNHTNIGILKLGVAQGLAGIGNSVPSAASAGNNSSMNQPDPSHTTGGGKHGLSGGLSSGNTTGAGPRMAPKTSRSNSLTSESSNISMSTADDPRMAQAGNGRPSADDIGVVLPSSSNYTESSSSGSLHNSMVSDTSKRQRELERRADRLMRRIRRLQTRQALSHVQKQLSGFVEHQHKSLQSMAKSIKTPQQVSGVDLKAEFLQSEDVKSLSTAALVNLVRKLQTNQSLSLRQRLSSGSSQLLPETSSSVLKLERDLCSELRNVAGNLQANVHHVENAVDSDATESSSGGESCDELDFDDWDGKVPRPALTRRSEWKWASNRAAIASRWTWLHAQVSDLEYRIRQQGEIYRQIRATKGAVTLGEQPPTVDFSSIRLAHSAASGSQAPQNAQPKKRLSPIEAKIADLERKNELSPCNLSTLLSNVDKQSTQLTQQLGCVYTPSSSTQSSSAAQTPKTPSGTPNGLVDTSQTSSRVSGPESAVDKASGIAVLHFDTPSPVSDITCQAARCRPVQSYHKRKILKTSGLYQLSRKAARLSTVRCRCYPPSVPCVMCSGRYHNVQSLEVEMPVPQRVALMDHSYHAVLSFKQDVPLSLQFGSLLKSGDWQRAAARASKLLAQDKKRARLSNGEPRVPRKYNKRVPKNASAAILSSTKKKKVPTATLR